MTQPHPAPPPPAVPQLTREDEEQLSLLSILFYVYAGFVALTALIFGAFAIVPAILIPAAAKGQPDTWLIGGVFLMVFGAIALLFLTKAVLMTLAGRAFGRRSGYLICMVGACVALMVLPIGTALGIFAILVLQRPAVKARFEI